MSLARSLSLKVFPVLGSGEVVHPEFGDPYTSHDTFVSHRQKCEAAINEAIERAAQECDDEHRIHCSNGCPCSAGEDCAERIRALKSESVK